jgi:tetratricopeptide (TPR) repeat protein
VLAAASLLCSSGAWASNEPEADPIAKTVAEAERYAAQAYAAYQKKDYAEAVALYQEALQAAPSADALFNIARIYDLGLRDRPLAITFYRRYVSDPGATPERIKRTNQRLTELKDAELAETETDPSTHPVAAPVVAAPAVAETLAAASWAADPGREGDSAWSNWSIAALTSGAAGTVALSVGIGYAVALKSAAGRANHECDGNDCRSQSGVEAAQAAARYERVANLGLGIGGGLLAGAALMWLLEPDSPQASRQAAVQLAPIAGASELGATLTGSW